MDNEISIFAEVVPSTFHQFAMLLFDRMALSRLPEMAGMIRLKGRWTDPGKASGKVFYSANTPAQAGAYIKERVQKKQAREAEVIKDQVKYLEKMTDLKKELTGAYDHINQMTVLLKNTKKGTLKNLFFWIKCAKQKNVETQTYQ